MSEPLNLYGDARLATKTGHGADIASQRADDLDLKAIAYIERLVLTGAEPHALDVGCGFGGQAIRMAKAGARVTAMDAEDYASIVLANASSHHLVDQVGFVCANVEDRPALPLCEVIACQRMIHYLPYANALEALQWMYAVGSPACHLFISASGLGSELGQGYSAASTPVEERFATLAPEMAAKHAIEPRVCLYRVDELVTLLERARWHVIESFSSPFGNAKAIASKVQ